MSMTFKARGPRGRARLLTCASAGPGQSVAGWLCHGTPWLQLPTMLRGVPGLANLRQTPAQQYEQHYMAQLAPYRLPLRQRLQSVLVGPSARGAGGPGDAWAGADVDALAAFLGPLLAVDASARCSAHQALAHPWLAGAGAVPEEGAAGGSA